MGAYQSAKSVLMCTCLGYFVPISLRRSAGGKSKRKSACPFSTCVTSASTERPNFCTMLSTKPSGMASADHCLKFGLRLSTSSWFGSYFVNMYAPVEGGSFVPRSLLGVPHGSTEACGTASL